MKPLIFGVLCLLWCQLTLDASSGTDGPPAPIPPSVITRDTATHRATIRAVRITTALRIDGRLDDEVYTRVEPISDFVQMEPHAGDASTEKTDLWILFDDEYVYVTFRCWESHPERMVVNEMRRDNYRLWLGENVAFMFDTFHDRRNGVEFGITPAGGRYEGQFTNERLYNGDWNPVWRVAVSRFANGWIAESAIPFTSLRFRPGRDQTWGFQARRINAWKNELSFLTPLPPELGMGRGIFAASLAPTLVGIEAPAHRSAHLEVKPYVTSDLATDRDATPSIVNHAGAHGGLDTKIGVNDHLSADVTVRPDFAQVEADEERINLTRFNLFFPEKREFFLENAGTFTFGNQNGGDMPIVFYSRRIGLNQGQADPIDAGGRLTGRLGDFTIGALDMQLPATSTASATNFGVFRLKRDLFGSSSIGVIATSRSAGDVDSARNSTYGVDGTFALSPSVTVNTYWAATDTQGGSPEHDISYRGQFDYIGDRYGVRLERVVVGSQFNPGLGFLTRPDMRKSAGTFRFSPRGRKGSRVRKYYLDALATYVNNNAGQTETRDLLSEFVVDFQNSDRLTLQHEYDAEFLPTPFAISSGITLPVAQYVLETTRAGYSWDPPRRFSGSVLLEDGRFYSGHRTAASVSAARMNVGAQFSIEPTYSINRVRLDEGDFTTTLAGSRLTYTVTPQLFMSALVQFNSATSTVSTNARLRWEYRPGSELFVVYNDERNTLTAAVLRNRAFVVKVNRLFRL